jgi:hypothetical protein
MSIETPILANMNTRHSSGVTDKGKNVMTARNSLPTGSIQGLYYHRTYMLNHKITFLNIYFNIRVHKFYLLDN